MKFGKRLVREMLREWTEHYINYKRLKKIIHAQDLQVPTTPSAEGSAAVLGTLEINIGHSDSDEKLAEVFIAALEDEVHRAEEFVASLVVDLDRRVQELTGYQPRSVREGEQTPNSLQKPPGSLTSLFPATPTRGDEKEDAVANTSTLDNVNVWATQWIRSHLFPATSTQAPVATTTPLLGSGTAVNEEAQLRQRKKDAFVEWNSNAFQARHFAEINAEAVRRIVKKLRKYCRRAASICAERLDELSERSKITAASLELEQMIDHAAGGYERQFGTPLEHYHNMTTISKDLNWHIKWPFVGLACLLFAISFSFRVFEDNEKACKCFSLFVLVITLWVTEAIPFFCTALMMPLVVIPMRIIQDPDTKTVASASTASKLLLGNMFNDMQVLVLGGLTIAKALNRVNLEVVGASWLQQTLGHRPSVYVLALMMISCVLSAVVSNVAAPLLVLGVIQKTLWEFPQGSTAPQAILLGLAFACNLGGMLSPIASPQSVVGQHIIDTKVGPVSFGKWVAIASPIVFLNVIVCWIILMWWWKPFTGPGKVDFIPIQLPSHSKSRRTSRVEMWLVLVVSAITVVLWCVPSDFLYGDTAVIAIIPILTFFGVGLLNKEDFNNLSWHLMFLLAGGNMLGLCTKDSGLVNECASHMESLISHMSTYEVTIIVLLFLVVVTTFISHTVAAIVMLPIIAEIGLTLPSTSSTFAASPMSLVFLSILMCSGAMAFPVSSFPNINSLLAENEHGKTYLRPKDFLLVGLLATLGVTVSLTTWMVPMTKAML